MLRLNLTEPCKVHYYYTSVNRFFNDKFTEFCNFVYLHKKEAFILTLYGNIEALCRAKGINITVMCRETGIGRATLTELKKGRSNTLRADILKRIADYFQVSTDYLLNGSENAVITYDSRTEELICAMLDNEDLYDAVLMLSDCSRRELKKIKAIIKTLREDYEEES